MADFSNILLAVDCDRTLTDVFGRIPARNLDAIRRFQENGGAFTVATGRSVPMFRPYFDQIPANAPFVLYNGAAFYDASSQTLSDVVEIPGCAALIRTLQARFPQLPLEVQGEDYHYVFGDNPMRDAFYRFNHGAMKQITMDELPPVLPKLAIYTEFRDKTVKRFFAVEPEEAAQMDAVEQFLAQSCADVVDPVRAAPGILDIQARGVNKGAAARRLAARLGRGILVCAGDALNDVSMLEEADYSFVPSDCVAELRESRYPKVCPCGEGSVADVIERLAAL